MVATPLRLRVKLWGQTKAEWEAETRILLQDELGLETDTKRIKRGNGTSPYVDLDYFDNLSDALASIAELEPDADEMIYFSGPNTAALTTITAFGRTLVATADLDALKMLLGITDLTERMGEAETAITALQADSTDHGERIGELETQIADHETRIVALES